MQIRHAETTCDTQAHAQITAGHVLVGLEVEGQEGGVQEVEVRIVLLRSQQEDIPQSLTMFHKSLTVPSDKQTCEPVRVTVRMRGAFGKPSLTA